MNSNTVFILDQYPHKVFSSKDEMIKFLMQVDKDKDISLFTSYNYSTGDSKREEIVVNKISSCTMINKVPLYDDVLYYSENSTMISKDIMDLIKKGYHTIVAFNPNVEETIDKPIFNGTNKEAALYLSRYARYRYLYIYENNVIEAFDINGLGFEIDYNFIFGDPFNNLDKVKTIDYDYPLKISFYEVSDLGIEVSNYSRDKILNAKFYNEDLNLHYVLIDEDDYDISRIFDSSQFKRV